MSFLRFILRRAAHHYQILLTLGLGVILATGLLASGPILVDTVVEFGLRNTLLAGNALARNLRVTVLSTSLDESAYRELSARVEELFARRFAGYLAQTVPQANSPWLFPWVDGAPLDGERVSLAFDERVLAETELVAGSYPASVLVDDRTVAVIVGEDLAEAYGLEAGDLLPASRNRGNDAPDLFLEIAGIVRPSEPRDPYWSGSLNPLRPRSEARWRAQTYVFVPPPAFFSTVARLFVGGRAELHWNILLDPSAILSTDIPRLEQALDGLIFELLEISPTRPVMETTLDQVLSSFGAQARAVRPPLLLLTAEVVLLALYYVVMVAALAVKQVEREFAVLNSRGAAAGQLFRIQLGEAVLIALVALGSGPGLGAALVRALGSAGPLSDVSRGAWNLSLSGAAWLAAGVGALACLAGLLLPVGPALRRSIVSQTRGLARDVRPPIWQRYYLDVFLLVGGLLLLWRMRLYGGIVSGSPGTQVDWLLLLSPLALLLGSGTIVLRVFPLVLRLGAALAARGRGLPTALAMWQTSRNPTHVARLVLLLTLAMSLGLLSTGISATLDLSEQERARYAVGGDLRLISSFLLPLGDFQEIAGVAGSTAVYRTFGSIVASRTADRFNLLAIDPAQFGVVATFRDDFADEPMSDLLDRLERAPETVQPTIALPGQPGRIGVWVWSAPDDPATQSGFSALAGDSHLDRIKLEARVETAAGQLVQITLLPTDNDPAGWRYFAGNVPDLGDGAFPLALHSFWLTNRARRQVGFGSNFVPASMQLALDDLTVTSRGGAAAQVVAGFDDLREVWQVTGNSFTTFGVDAPRSGRARLDLFLRELEGRETVRIALVAAEPAFGPLPALIDTDLQQQTNVAVGDVLRATVASRPVDFRIQGIVSYFPTLYDDLEAGFMVTSRAGLLAWLNDQRPGPLNPNELLLDLDPAVDAAQIAEAALMEAPDLEAILDYDVVRATIKADPMALGLRSVTFFGYILTTALSLVGFATHFYLGARQRETVYAVLRSIGMSSGQLYRMLALEQVVLILFGLGLGTLLGVILNRITLPGLPITLGGTLPVPPFVPRSDWGAVGRIYAVLAGGFLTALGVATWLLWRRQLHRILRIGEE